MVLQLGQTHWLDELIKLHPLAEPHQGNIVVIVVGLEVWVEDNLVHWTIGGREFVPSIMESKEYLEEQYFLDWLNFVIMIRENQHQESLLSDRRRSSRSPLYTLTCLGTTAMTVVSLRWDIRTWAAVRTQDSESRAPEPNQWSSGTRDRSSTLSRTCQGKRPGSALRPPTILFIRAGRVRDGWPQAGGHSNTWILHESHWSTNICSLMVDTWQTNWQSGSKFWTDPFSPWTTAVGTCSTHACKTIQTQQ